MNGMRQGWLVAMREMRERSRSRAFRISVVLMIVTVAAMLVLPALLTPSSTRNVGLTGSAPSALAAAISQQAHAVGTTARVHRYASLAAAEQAVRQGRLDVLVAARGGWNGKAGPMSSSRQSSRAPSSWSPCASVPPLRVLPPARWRDYSRRCPSAMWNSALPLDAALATRRPSL